MYKVSEIRKIKKIALFLFGLFLFVGINLQVVSARANDGKKNEKETQEAVACVLTASFGFDGNVHEQRDNFLKVTIENPGERDIKGYISVSFPWNNWLTEKNSMANYKYEVQVVAGECADIELPVKVYDIFEETEVELHSLQGELIDRVSCEANMVGQTETMMGIFSDDLDGLRYMEECFDGVLAELNDTSMPTKGSCLDGFDLMVVGDYDLEMLSEKQRQALLQWNQKGGTILLGNSQYAKKNGSLLGCRIENHKKKSVLKGKNVVAIRNASDAVFAYAKKDALGSVLVYADPLEKNTGESEGKRNIKSSMEYFGATAKNMQQEDFWVDGMKPVKYSLHHSQYPNLWLIAGILILYILMIGGGLRVYLKKREKLEWLWGIIPMAAIVFFVLIAVIGKESRLEGTYMSHNTVVTYDQEAEYGVAEGAYEVFSSEKSDVSLEFPRGVEVYPGGGSSGTVTRKEDVSDPIGMEVVYGEKKNSLTLMGEGVFSTSVFSTKYRVKKSGDYSVKLKQNGSQYEGSISNYMGTTMKQACLLVGEKLYYIGDIPNGTTVEVNDSLPKTVLQSYSYFFVDSLVKKWFSFGDNTKNAQDGTNSLESEYAGIVQYYLLDGSYEKNCIEGKLFCVMDLEDADNIQWGTKDFGYTVSAFNLQVEQGGEEYFITDVTTELAKGVVNVGVNENSEVDFVVNPNMKSITKISYTAELNDTSNIMINAEEVEQFQSPRSIWMYNFEKEIFENTFDNVGQELEGKALAPYISDVGEVRIMYEATGNGDSALELRPILSATLKEVEG